MEVESNKSRLEEFISNPYKALWKLSIPMMLGMSVQALYMLIDTAFIGKWVGDTALAALGYVFPLLFILMGITFGLGSGATTVIAQFIGAKDKKNADNTALHTLLIGLIIGIIIIIISLYWGSKLISIQGANEETIEVALKYFHIMAAGSIFMIFAIFFRAILSGEGDVIFPMKVLGVGTILNIILDPILIYFYQISGAAYATVISQFIVTLIYINVILLRKKSYLSFNFSQFNFDFKIIKNIFKLGIPASLSMIIISLGVVLFNRILDHPNGVAAYQTAGRIEHLFFLPIIAIATSLVTLIGMFYGAKRLDLINNMIKYGLSYSIIISISFSIFFFFYSIYIIPIFTESQEIIQLSILYFKIMAFAYPFISIGMCCSRIMQGLGYAYPMFILTIFRVIIISISLAWYFVTFLNKPIYFAWIGTLISCILTSIVSFIWLLLIIKKTLNMKSVII